MKVRGTMENAKSIEVLQDNVYIRKNIIKIEESLPDNEQEFVGWEYDEIVIPLEEYMSYMELLGQQNTDLEIQLIEQGQYITDLELRLLNLEVK